ncbi:2380_t:CDS:1 [Funneliformis caledonium]|uniref:2380_t:CDS:1 n=1 Tax=Funneliformis caledonium TaxID=1117310 RepID=A0A9N9FCA7_9GLOM|nr:2380_t:CDS:1 [Funneliformis caledonium]
MSDNNENIHTHNQETNILANINMNMFEFSFVDRPYKISNDIGTGSDTNSQNSEFSRNKSKSKRLSSKFSRNTSNSEFLSSRSSRKISVSKSQNQLSSKRFLNLLALMDEN